jgi:hypothetical protein
MCVVRNKPNCRMFTIRLGVVAFAGVRSALSHGNHHVINYEQYSGSGGGRLIATDTDLVAAQHDFIDTRLTRDELFRSFAN